MESFSSTRIGYKYIDYYSGSGLVAPVLQELRDESQTQQLIDTQPALLSSSYKVTGDTNQAVNSTGFYISLESLFDWMFFVSILQQIIFTLSLPTTKN